MGSVEPTEHILDLLLLALIAHFHLSRQLGAGLNVDGLTPCLPRSVKNELEEMHV